MILLLITLFSFGTTQGEHLPLLGSFWSLFTDDKAQTKSDHLLERVKKSIEQGTYRLSRHAVERKKERDLDLPDILYVLKHGFHEENKDHWNEKFSTWNYAIRGKTLDGADVRVIVGFEKPEMVIITVIRLKEHER